MKEDFGLNLVLVRRYKEMTTLCLCLQYIVISLILIVGLRIILNKIGDAMLGIVKNFIVCGLMFLVYFYDACVVPFIPRDTENRYLSVINTGSSDSFAGKVCSVISKRYEIPLRLHLGIFPLICLLGLKLPFEEQVLNLVAAYILAAVVYCCGFYAKYGNNKEECERIIKQHNCYVGVPLNIIGCTVTCAGMIGVTVGGEDVKIWLMRYIEFAIMALENSNILEMGITLIGSMLLLIAIIFLLGIPFMILINFGIGLVGYVSQYDEW